MGNQTFRRFKTWFGGSTLAISLCTGSVLLASEPAEATFRVCNKARQDVFLVLGYLDVNRDVRRLRGWYRFANNECRTLHEPPYNIRYYYVHAQTADGEREWSSSDHQWCVRYGRESWFRWAPGGCRDRDNGRLEGFLKVDMNSGDVRNRTFTLFVAAGKVDEVNADNTYPPISYPRER